MLQIGHISYERIARQAFFYNEILLQKVKLTVEYTRSFAHTPVVSPVAVPMFIRLCKDNANCSKTKEPGQR